MGELLGIKKPYHSGHWKTGPHIGKDYSSLKPGDIVGWPSPFKIATESKKRESGHVAVFVGKPDMMFIHVSGCGKPIKASPCWEKHRELYRMSY